MRWVKFRWFWSNTEAIVTLGQPPKPQSANTIIASPALDVVIESETQLGNEDVVPGPELQPMLVPIASNAEVEDAELAV